MRRHSTGALTEEQKAQQEARYGEGRSYDYVIMGTGMSTLAAGALLAKSGAKVCMVEAHDAPGGYAHTFEMEGFHFCAQVHYIWGCAPGQSIHQFLSHLGIEKDVSFQTLDADGYDRAGLPDGNLVGIPYGYDKLVESIDGFYPGQKEKLQRFVKVIENIRDEVRNLPDDIRWYHYISAPLKYPTLLKYRNSTLQDLYDECGLSKEAQAVLCASAGDFGAPPRDLSVIAYSSLMSGYNEGAYYPTKHFSHFIGSVAEFIQNQPGCDIYYETEVVDILVEDGKVNGFRSEDGKLFQGETYICNMDPEKGAEMIGLEHFPSSYLPKVQYEYSPSCFITYAGVKDIDLRDYGLGSSNIWQFEQWNMNTMWDETLDLNFEKPWYFLSSPSLRTNDRSDCPEGCQSLQFGNLVSYEAFANMHENDPKKYRKTKKELRERLIDLIEERYIPGLRKHLKMMVTGTPTTNEDFCWAPKGNCYGSMMRPENMGPSRLTADTPFDNFFWCNASSGYAGIHGTTLTGIGLYKKLTGDAIIDKGKVPTVEKAIEFAKTRQV